MNDLRLIFLPYQSLKVIVAPSFLLNDNITLWRWYSQYVVFTDRYRNITFLNRRDGIDYNIVIHYRINLYRVGLALPVTVVNKVIHGCASDRIPETDIYICFGRSVIGV